MKTWRVILILSAAQFILVLDTTVMNVSISNVVADLHTTVGTVQLAITAYMLVMASTMLIGGRLGDLWGRRLAFRIGLVVFAVGSGLTALAQSAALLLFGWSLLEGLGAALLVPSLAALIAANYEGRKRATAYGIIGAVAAAGAAAGPLIGGAVTTALSWRVVFAGEVVIAIFVLLASGMIDDARSEEESGPLDWVGGVLSVSGLMLVVLGVQASSAWGWLVPRNPPEIGGTEITPLGLSPTPFVIFAGLVVLLGFARWVERRERRGEEPLLRIALLRVRQLRGGAIMFFAQQTILLGTFFAVPLYLQVVLGEDAFETGVKLLPLSIVMLLTAMAAPSLAGRFSPRAIVRAGLMALLVSSLGLVGSVDYDLNSLAFGVSLAVMGFGGGLMVSQIGNVIMSSVGPSETGEAAGIQGTFQYLGGAFGTALVGAVLLIGLNGAFQSSIEDNAKISQPTQERLAAATEEGVEFVPTVTVEAKLEKSGAPPGEVEEITAGYEDSQILALKVALLAVAAFVVVSLWFTRTLPDRPLVAAPPAGA
jgi:EmrB/QacA subfamily drug resistance transporter